MISLYAGLTSQTIDVFLQDSSSSTGAGLAGLVFNTGSLTAYYRKGATGSATAITLATQTVGGAWSSGGFVEIDATNMKGVYRLDVPNAMIDAEGFVTLVIRGAANLLSTAIRIDCRPLPVDVKKLLGTAWLAPAVAGTPDVNTKTLTAGAIVAASLAASALNGKGDWLLSSGYTAPANSTIALIYALLQLTDSDVASIVTLFGTPTGASFAADLAAIKLSADAALRPTVSGRTLNVSAAGAGDAELDTAYRVKLAAEQPDYAPALEPQLRGDLTLAEAVDLILAGVLGVSSQPAETTELFKFVDAVNAFTTTFDTAGNRTAVEIH